MSLSSSSEMVAGTTSKQYNNKMGKWGATSYIIGNTIGSGIFITPQSILENASSIGLALIIWVVSAVVAMFGAICYVELGTSIRRSGADFAYLSYVEWRALAFAFVSCGCLLNYPATIAIQSETFAEYLLRGFRVEFCDPFTRRTAQKLIAFSTVWILLFLNFFSVRTFVARFQIMASLAKIFSTVIIIGTGAYVLFFTDVGASNLANPFANSTYDSGQLTSAFFAGLFSYDGWDVLNFGAEELENPASSMLFAVLVGMSTVAVIFSAMNLAYFTVLTLPQIRSSSAIATTFAQSTLGSFQHVVLLMVSVVLIGSINSTLFSASRYIFAAARARQFPSWISCMNQKHDSPRGALVAHVALGVLLSFAGDLGQLLNYVGFSQWIQRSLTMLVFFYLRFGKKPVHPEAVRIPMPIAFIFFVAITTLVVTTVFQDFRSAQMTLLVIGVAWLLYYMCVRREGSLLSRFCPIVDRLLTMANEYSCRLTQIALNGVINVDDDDEGCTMSAMEALAAKRRAHKENEKEALGEITVATVTQNVRNRRGDGRPNATATVFPVNAATNGKVATNGAAF